MLPTDQTLNVAEQKKIFRSFCFIEKKLMWIIQTEEQFQIMQKNERRLYFLLTFIFLYGLVLDLPIGS